MRSFKQDPFPVDLFLIRWCDKEKRDSFSDNRKRSLFFFSFKRRWCRDTLVQLIVGTEFEKDLSNFRSGSSLGIFAVNRQPTFVVFSLVSCCGNN